MKIIGLLGGMSWESTATYYRLINQSVNTTLGSMHSAEIVMYSVDFETIEKLQASGDWQKAGELLSDVAVKIQNAGADCLLICTNTMHKVYTAIESAVDIPVLHIADATGSELVSSQVERVGLLGTAFTMEQNFYKQRLVERFGLEVVTPNNADRAEVHRIIYQELCLGKIEAASQVFYYEVINKFKQQGIQAVILGCTEIGLLIDSSESCLPLFDTAKIHADAAVKFALA